MALVRFSAGLPRKIFAIGAVMGQQAGARFLAMAWSIRLRMAMQQAARLAALRFHRFRVRWRSPCPSWGGLGPPRFAVLPACIAGS